MLDKNIFDPEKISLIEFKILKGQVEVAEYFNIDLVKGHDLDNSLKLGFNINDQLAKADFIINIITDSKGGNDKEASGNFHLSFIYQIENLNELAIYDKNNRLVLNPNLLSALSSITYSTSRGILLTRLQGTALQNFILPIINPSKLLKNNG